MCRRRLASDLARASEGTPAQGALEDHHDRLPGSPHHRSNLCGVSVCYRVVMLKLLLALVISSLAVEQPLLAQTATRQEPISTAVVRQRTAEGEVERNLQAMRLSSGLPHLKQVPASESEVELTCTAAQTGQEGSRSGAWQSPHLRDQRSSRSNGAVEVSCVRHLAVPRRRTSSACLLR